MAPWTCSADVLKLIQRIKFHAKCFKYNVYLPMTSAVLLVVFRPNSRQLSKNSFFSYTDALYITVTRKNEQTYDWYTLYAVLTSFINHKWDIFICNGQKFIGIRWLHTSYLSDDKTILKKCSYLCLFVSYICTLLLITW